MLDLTFLILLTAWSALVGGCCLSWIGVVPDHRADRLALALPIGLGFMALIVLVLAEVGILSSAGILITLGLIALGSSCWGGSYWWRPPTGPRFLSGRFTVLDWAFALTLVLGAFGSLLTALAPVTDGDALCYHLQVPKVFLEGHSAGFEPDLHETVYPLVTELLYAVALALRGPIACRLVSWLFGMLFALNVTALGRPLLGARCWWAGTIALLVPAITNGMSAPLNDVALAGMATAALYAWTLWVERPTVATAIATGVLGGFAVGVKYPGLVWVGLLGLAMLRPRAHAWRHALAFGASVLLVGGWWYLRAYLHTGNPVHPFFREVFGSGIDDVLDPIKRPLAVTPWNLVTALVPITLDPDRFDSFSHQFGPSFLLFLPGLALCRPPRRLIVLTALALGFLTLCLTVRQSTRFVLPTIGPLAVAVAWLALRWRDRPTIATRTLLVLLLLVLGFETAIATGHARHGLRVVLGLTPPERYLDDREPTYRVGRWIDQHLSSSAHVIGQDHRGFYIPRPYTMELAHRRRTGLGRHGETAQEVIRVLQSRGFTHLLLCPPIPESAVEYDPTLVRTLAPWLDGREPVYDEKLADADGVIRHYRIYCITNESRLTRGNEVAVDERFPHTR